MGNYEQAPGGYGQPPGGSGGGFGPKTDALAIVAIVGGLLAIAGATGNLVSGFFGMCCPLCTIGGAFIGVIVAIPAIVGIVTGALSYRRTTSEPHVHSGKALALVGMITSVLALLMTIVTVIGPWIGLGCIGATAPDRPTTQQSPWNTPLFTVDAGTPWAVPPSVPPVAPDPNVQGAGAGACSRIGACCRAYVAAMGNMSPTMCDAYDTIPASMTDSMCDQTMSGYRSGLSATNRAIPTECQ